MHPEYAVLITTVYMANGTVRPAGDADQTVDSVKSGSERKQTKMK